MVLTSTIKWFWRVHKTRFMFLVLDSWDSRDSCRCKKRIEMRYRNVAVQQLVKYRHKCSKSSDIPFPETASLYSDIYAFTTSSSSSMFTLGILRTFGHLVSFRPQQRSVFKPDNKVAANVGGQHIVQSFGWMQVSVLPLANIEGQRHTSKLGNISSSCQRF